MRLDTQTRFKRVDNFIEMVKSELDRFESNQKLVIGTMRKLTYANDVQSQLNIQDEIDREWISLFAGLDDRTGYQKVAPEDKLRERSQFFLNRDCISCTSNMDLKLNLFKIACLKYEANPVTYQGKQIERKELLSLQKVITDMAV